jgi:hypothetical protein
MNVGSGTHPASDSEVKCIYPVVNVCGKVRNMWSCTSSPPSFSSCDGASLSIGTTKKAVKGKMGLKSLRRMCRLDPV